MARGRASGAKPAPTMTTSPHSGSSETRRRRQSSQTQRPVSSTTPTSSKQSTRIRKTPKDEETTPIAKVTAGPASRKKSTPKKSQYFSEDVQSQLSESSELSEGDESVSSYEADDVDAPTSGTSASEGEDDDSGYSESEEKMTSKRKRKGGQIPSSIGKRKITAQETVRGAEKDLWRVGASAGLGPGKKVIVRLPKARDAGKTPYNDETIHPNTLLFLQDLAKNNDREWLKLHDADFRTSEKDFDSFVAVLTDRIIERDDTIPELPVKDLKFRIYRDIRFSPDQTPYKSHFSAAWSRTGRKGPYAAYYVQVAPGRSFVGGGVWHPDAQPLALLRHDIDRNPHKIKRVLMEPRIRKEFFDGTPSNEKKAVAAYVSHNQENALKTKPKGFDSDHPNIALLRLRNYTIGKRLKDHEVVGPGGLDRISDLVGVLVPFITYLNSVVMPDDPPSEEEESSEEEPETEEDAAGEQDEEEDEEEDVDNE